MSQDIIVRCYCSEDLDAIKEILSDYPSPTGRVWSNQLVERMITDALEEQPDGVFVAEKGGKVVGFAIVLQKEWFNIAYLDYIQVKTKWMDKGIGHKLIESCIDWAKERDARIIYTETGEDNEGAIKFYQRHGFQITGSIPDYYKEGLGAVFLVKKIK